MTYLPLREVRFLSEGKILARFEPYHSHPAFLLWREPWHSEPVKDYWIYNI
jgi:hypothetical protein